MKILIYKCVDTYTQITFHVDLRLHIIFRYYAQGQTYKHAYLCIIYVIASIIYVYTQAYHMEYIT